MALISLRSSSSLQLIVSSISSKPSYLLPSPIVSVPFTRFKSKRTSVSPTFRPRLAVARGGDTDAVADYRGDIGEILGDVSIFTASGQRVQISDLWDQNDVCMLYRNYLFSHTNFRIFVYDEFLWFMWSISFWIVVFDIHRELLLLCFWGISDAFAGKFNWNPWNNTWIFVLFFFFSKSLMMNFESYINMEVGNLLQRWKRRNRDLKRLVWSWWLLVLELLIRLVFLQLGYASVSMMSLLWSNVFTT